MINLKKGELNIQKEWIITNGLGGYSSSTIINLNTRKYHGLLISSLESPVKRHLILSKVEEVIETGNYKINLGVNQYNKHLESEGYKHLDSFNFDIYPEFNYKIKDVEIIKKVIMPKGYNAVVVSYKIKSKINFKFKLRPFVNYRNFNSLRREFNFKQDESELTTVLRESNLGIVMGCDRGKYKKDEFVVYNINYQEEKERGYEFTENHFSPGEFSLDIKKGNSNFNFICVGDFKKKALEDFSNLYSINSRDYDKFFIDKTNRVNNLIKQTCEFNNIKRDKLLNCLVKASDDFVTNKNIIAGYHWFSPFYRDTLISLPGLCLVTGRIKEAKEMLLDINNKINNLVPNFMDEDGNLSYNSIDSSLWYIYSVYKFYLYTKNSDFIKNNLWLNMKLLVHNYLSGTLYGIKVKEGLVSQEANESLTWNDTMYTIRKNAVEVNVLWYNALRIMEFFSHKFNEDNSEYSRLGDETKDSFNKKFWNGEFLWDDLGSRKLTCNQIFSISLPFRLLSRDKELRILKIITEKLLTPYGLRSLDYNDKDYCGTYYGNQSERDLCYHNGTVWAYLLGFYLTAYIRLHKDKVKAKKEALEKIINHIEADISNCGVGSISEIYDGEFPHSPRGCISQAWSVAEILRAYVEDVLK